MTGTQARHGLHDPNREGDSCGVGLVADIRGRPSRDLVEDALEVLRRLAHRGATGADPRTGDGAGILLQLPHAFLVRQAREHGVSLPAPGHYAVGQVFLPADETERSRCQAELERAAEAVGLGTLFWRTVPVVEEQVGPVARRSLPVIRQWVLANPGFAEEPLARALYRARKRAENRIRQGGLDQERRFHVASLSSRTLVYKGLLLPQHVADFFPDLVEPDVHSALALVHSRFSTNTFPSWHLAQPFRYVAHNGEINTLCGNVNWMAARRRMLKSEELGADVEELWPVIVPGGSDSAQFDNVVELLVMAGRSLPHALMMMVPEAWDASTPPERRAFYQHSSMLMEPWDGPAAMVFTDGLRAGARLDRNGLRPARYLVTEDDRFLLASEAGVLDIPEARVRRKGRLGPGQLILVDTVHGHVQEDAEVKRQVTSRLPYAQWLGPEVRQVSELPPAEVPARLSGPALVQLQRAFGYTAEDIKLLLAPMAQDGKEPVGSMGTDTPLAVLSHQAPNLFDYFHQLFAQVTNPPMDSIRERLVMSLSTILGPEGSPLEDGPVPGERLEIDGVVLTNAELAQLRSLPASHGLAPRTLSLLYTPDWDYALGAAVLGLCNAATEAVRAGAGVLVLSDRGVDAKHVAIPSLLALSAVHQHLVRQGTRMQVGLLVETAEVREVHHVALLVGYGAGAVNPWLALDSAEELAARGDVPGDGAHAVDHVVHALNEGVLKVMSKMGISSVQSYRGAQLFEAVGLDRDLVELHFTGTPSRVHGVGLPELGQEAVQRHARGFAPAPEVELLPAGGRYQWRREGEAHKWNPGTIGTLQHATRAGDRGLFRRYLALADDESRQLFNLRSLLRIREEACTPVPLEEVESAAEIVKRMVSGAMSFGSISAEAHETLAIAMNRLGARSNSGEGGEEPRRFHPDENGDLRRSAIKQVASARFGVTPEYLVNADELQIKMAQGAKPGEGGQLPGAKVDERIARVRCSTPGVTLISPPPHHDIYSIEDLAQLIHDLQSINPVARISVKLVSECGVGTVAAGVAKAGAGCVTICGYEGGTGASPLSSIRHAGLPWELGLAETQQVLVQLGLRERLRVQVDGGLRTARDVLVAGLLGAEEFGLATAALVVTGCVLLRKCHLNTCSVGIATQDPKLRESFAGRPEHVVNFFTMLAEEVRAGLARLGFRRFQDLVGQVELLEPVKDVADLKARRLDLSALVAPPVAGPRRCAREQRRDTAGHLDHRILAEAGPVLAGGAKLRLRFPVRNTDRAVGTLVSGEIARRWGRAGLPEDALHVRLDGTAGQSLGAFLSPGITLELHGAANDYVGKGQGGGRIVVRPPADFHAPGEHNVVAGNTLLYGATGGEAFFRGVVGDRFGVRNSGAVAVVEGTGDHACEYMTGGVVLVLGRTGRNTAAGMSGGLAFLLDEDGTLPGRCNLGTVALEPLTDDDARFVHHLLERHHHHTGSSVAQRLLATWPLAQRQVVKVLPHEFRRLAATSLSVRPPVPETATAQLG